MTRKKHLIFSALLALTFALPTLFVSDVFADDIYEVVFRKKQEVKKQTRSGWNLTDWIRQRDSRRIQDLWLAMHTPVPYEFILGGSYRWLTEPEHMADHRLSFTAFAKIFGLSVERETEPLRYNALFLLRLLGWYNQGTNITLHAGLRAQNEPAFFRSSIYGISTTLYLARFFGVEGMLRVYGKGTPNSSGQDFKGVMKEANLFIDFKMIRIYGGYLATPMDHDRGIGYQVGTRLYF